MNKFILTSTLVLTFFSACKKSNNNTQSKSNSKLNTNAKTAVYAEIDGLPELKILNVQSGLKVSKSSSCDGTCTSSSREYTVFIYPEGEMDFQLQIELNKNRAHNNDEFYAMVGKIPFISYWFQDPINLGTPEVNGAEVSFFHKSKKLMYLTDPDFSNTKNQKDAVINNSISGSSFKLTKFNSNTIEGVVNCTLRASDNTKITIRNLEFRASY